MEGRFAGCHTLIVTSPILAPDSTGSVAAHPLPPPPQVTRVVFVPDSADVIASELRLMSAAVDVVFTTGGVGPTLDDVTMAGVARAFNRALVRCRGS